MLNVQSKLIALSLIALIQGCGFVVKKNDQSETESADKETIKTLNENGLQLEAYDASLWGFILSARSVPQAAPASEAQAQAQAEDNPFSLPSDQNGAQTGTDPSDQPGGVNEDVSNKPDSSTPKIGLIQKTALPDSAGGMVDDSLIAEDTNTVFDAPNTQYGYIAVRKCLKIETIIDDGLTAKGIYCLQVPVPEKVECQSPRSLVRGGMIRESLNNITNENLDLGSLLTSKLGFTYNSKSRIWSKESDGITISLSPLRIAALSLESPCSTGADGEGDTGGGYPVDPQVEGLTRAKLDLSSRLAIPMKIAVDSASRTYIPSASAGTASKFSMRVGRFMPDGSPDKSFGTDGYVELSKLEMNSAGYVVKLNEAKNRVYISGYQKDEWSKVIVVLNLNGQLDTTWGSEGVVATKALHTSFDVDIEGRVIVWTQEGFKRLLANGEIDKTFGQSGVRAVALEMPYIADFVVRGDTFYLVSEESNRNSVSLVSGKFIDTKNKITKVAGLVGDDMQSNQIAASDDLIVIYGRKYNETNSQDEKDGYWVAAFDPGANLIPGFGEGGIFRSNTGSSQNDVVFLSSKSFWLSGWNGSIRKFDVSGKIVQTINSTQFYLGADAMAIAPDGFLVGAYVAHGGGEMFRAGPEFLDTFK